MSDLRSIIELAFMKIYTEYLNVSPIPCFNPDKDQTKYPKNAYHLKDMNTFNMNIVFLILPLGIIRNKKCHKHVTNAPKGIGLALDTFEER